MKNNSWRFNLYCDSDRNAFEEYLCKQKYDEELDSLLVAFGRRERAMRMQDFRWHSLYELNYVLTQAASISTEERIMKNSLNRFIRQCVDELPQIQKRRIIMYYWQGLSYVEISKIENVSKIAVAYSIKKAKAKIMNKLLRF